MTDKRLLISYAHPDDESFGNGGLIARYVREGTDVYYLCATNGDLGTIPEDMKAIYPTVADLRLSELAKASAILGFREVFKLGYKDSGMMGNAGNDDPQSLWYQGQHDPATLVRQVVDVIRKVQPQVILTFDKFGGYGHPDHIAIQRATTEAFYKAGDASYVTDLPPYQPQKLYYGSLPATMLRLMGWMMRLRGYDLRKMGTNKDMDFQAVLDHIEPIHTRVDVRDYLAIWDEAGQAHKSQGGGGFLRGVPMFLRRFLMGTQGFSRVVPLPPAQRVDEYDLFTGVTTAPIELPTPV